MEDFLRVFSRRDATLLRIEEKGESINLKTLSLLLSAALLSFILPPELIRKDSIYFRLWRRLKSLILMS